MDFKEAFQATLASYVSFFVKAFLKGSLSFVRGFLIQLEGIPSVQKPPLRNPHVFDMFLVMVAYSYCVLTAQKEMPIYL